MAFHFKFRQVVYYIVVFLIRSLLMGSCSFSSSSSCVHDRVERSSEKHNAQHSAFNYNGCCVQFVYLQLVFVFSLCWLNSFRMFFWLTPSLPGASFYWSQLIGAFVGLLKFKHFQSVSVVIPTPSRPPCQNQEVLLCYSKGQHYRYVIRLD